MIVEISRRVVDVLNKKMTLLKVHPLLIAESQLGLKGRPFHAVAGYLSMLVTRLCILHYHSEVLRQTKWKRISLDKLNFVNYYRLPVFYFILVSNQNVHSIS